MFAKSTGLYDDKKPKEKKEKEKEKESTDSNEMPELEKDSQNTERK